MGRSAAAVPVHPITRFGLTVVGAVLGTFPGILLGQIPRLSTVAWVTAVLLSLAGAVRGLSVRVWLQDGVIGIRNLWRTYWIAADKVERLDELKGQGILKATNPALVVDGRRLRLPIHAAMLWGGLVRSDWTKGDNQRARLLREWADRNGVRVEGSVRDMTEPPRESRWTRLRRSLRP